MAVQLDSGKGGKKSPKPIINVTPLVDVVLVLLIIFMVVIPNMQEHKTIELFKTTHAEEDSDEEKNALVVTMAHDGTFHMQSEQLPRGQVLTALQQARADEPDRRVMLRADTRLEYGEVRAFFYSVKELGFDRVKLAVGAVQQGDLAAGMMGE